MRPAADKGRQAAGIKQASAARDKLSVSGRVILEALAGVHYDPDVLAELVKGRVQAKRLRRPAWPGVFGHHAFPVSERLAHLNSLFSGRSFVRLSRRIEEPRRHFADRAMPLDAIPGSQRTIKGMWLSSASTGPRAPWIGICTVGPGISEAPRTCGQASERTMLIEAAGAAIRGEDRLLPRAPVVFAHPIRTASAAILLRDALRLEQPAARRAQAGAEQAGQPLARDALCDPEVSTPFAVLTA